VLASIRSKTGGDAAVCCRTRRDAVALYIASKPKKRKNRSTSSEYTRLVNLFECNLVPEWRCLVLLFPLLVRAPYAAEACLPSEGPYGETGRFCVEPPTFILQAVRPSTLEPRRGATVKCSLVLSIAVSFPGPSE
jgi:hypothetical protein